MSESLISQLIELENKHNTEMQLKKKKFNAASKILSDKIEKQASQESKERFFLVSRNIARNMIALYGLSHGIYGPDHDFTLPHVSDPKSIHTANINISKSIDIIIHYNPYEYCLVRFINGKGISGKFNGYLREAIEVTEDEDIITENIKPRTLKKYPILISKSSRKRFVSIKSFFNDEKIRNEKNEYLSANTKRR